MGQYTQPKAIDTVAHAVNSIHVASANLKSVGAIETLKDVLLENMPQAPANKPEIACMEAYERGEEAYLNGKDYHSPIPVNITSVKDYKAGWLHKARSQCGMYQDLKTILEKAPEIEKALTKAGKTRLANHMKKLFTPTTDEGRGVMQHTA